jgi:hypothetical protein
MRLLRRPLQHALLALAGVSGCTSVRSSPANAEAAVGTELAREYGAIVEGFKRNDPSAWIARLAPDFRLILFNGAVQSREWAVDYVRNNANVFHVDSLSMTVTSVRPEQDRWIATVRQLSSRTFSDSTGAHRLEVGAMQIEAWSRMPSGWMLRSVQEKEVLYLRRDGVPPSR